LNTLFVFIATGLSLVWPCAHAQVTDVGDDYVRAFETELNNYRATHGLAPLRRNNAIERVAVHHAAYLALLHQKSTGLVATHDEYTKVEGVKALGSIQRRFAYFGEINYGECCAAFEEHALVAPSALLDAWVESPPHERALRGSFYGYGLAISTVERDGKTIMLAVLTLTNR